MPRTKTKKQEVDYTAVIKILGKSYTAKGKTVSEAIASLKPLGKAAGTSLLSISKGKAKKDRVLTHFQVFRLFSASKLMREIALKNTSILFDI